MRILLIALIILLPCSEYLVLSDVYISAINKDVSINNPNIHPQVHD